MTYKLNPCVGKIKSPIVLRFPTGEEKRFGTGADAAEADFDRHYAIAEMAAKESKVFVKLEVLETPITDKENRDATFF